MKRILVISAICFLLFSAFANAQVPENLDEMIARKARISSGSYIYNVSLLENNSNFYIWQPETLMYKDITTGHEVWKMSDSPGVSNYYHNDIDLNPWSADGKYLSWSSLRPTKRFNNYDSWAKVYNRIWMISGSDGSLQSTPANTPMRTVGPYPLFWSPQTPDVYYQTGDDHYMGSTGVPNVLYKVTLNGNGDVSRSQLLNFTYASPSAGVYFYVVSISPDGKRILALDGGGGLNDYSSVALFPATVFPDSQAQILVTQGYPYFRNASMSSYSNTPAFFDHAHSGVYKLLDPNGDWFVSDPSGGSCNWKYKTVGSAPDGGPLYTGDKIPPTDQPPYDFGEVIPDYGCNPNPFNLPYFSHRSYDQWGRYVVFSNAEDEVYSIGGPGAGIWDTLNNSYVVITFTGGAQHNSWAGFTDWAITTAGPATVSNCISLGYSSDYIYTNDRIYTEKYNDQNSRVTVVYTHTLYNNGGCYAGAGYEYSAIPRPAQSPDGTKVAFHSTFLNAKNGTYDDKPDIFWAVAYYPYPPANLSASWNAGVLLTWLPPKYTTRGWPNETTDPAPYAREIKRYHIWRSSSQSGPWQELGSINAIYHVDNYYGLVHDTNNLQFTDNTGDGTFYYTLTSEEQSGLESDSLSEILQVTVSGGAITSQQIVQPKGQKNFWTTSPQSPYNFQFNGTTTPGQYRLSWAEPSDQKIRYYNIYYSNSSNPAAIQQDRIASVPKGNSKYLDWLADPSNPGYYGITSVDRHGNECPIVLSGLPSCIHKSEIQPCNGCVDSSELFAFIDRWKVNSSDVILRELIEAIGLWKKGEC